jgi:hypothetical protein
MEKESPIDKYLDMFSPANCAWCRDYQCTIATLTAERDAGAKLLARQTDLAREAETQLMGVTREREALKAEVEKLRTIVRAARSFTAHALAALETPCDRT